MRGVRLLAVLPYEGLKKLFLAQIKDFSEIQLTAVVADRYDAVKVVADSLSKGSCDMVVSRGGTAELLRKEFGDITVLDIPVGFDDIFKAVLLAQNYKEKFAVVSFPSIAESARNLCNMLRYDNEVFAISSEEESKQKLRELRKQGYTMIVGDVTTASHANAFGMNTILLMSGEKSVRSVLQQVVDINNIKKDYIERSNYLAGIKETIPDFIGIYDEMGTVLFTNHEDTDSYVEIVNYIARHFDSIKKHDEFKAEFHANKKICVLYSRIRKAEEGVNIIIYGREVYDDASEKMAGITMMEETDDDYVFESHFGVANSIGKMKDAISKCCDVHNPILILGENGCGKDAAAASIHRLGYNKNGPCFVIDYANMTVKEWNDFFMKTSSPLLGVKCTVYFKNLQEMSDELQKTLIDFIENSNLCRRNQIIFSAVVRFGEENCRMVDYLLARTKCVLLQAMPLRKRLEDLPSLTAIYVGEINIQTGKQFLGLDGEAMDVLAGYSWPGNITQLKRVLLEAALLADGNYITAGNIKTCIENEMFELDESVVCNIDLNQSLDEITYDVVRMVVKEEGNSKKKAAERLGISRTTVWRILNSHNGRK